MIKIFKFVNELLKYNFTKFIDTKYLFSKINFPKWGGKSIIVNQLEKLKIPILLQPSLSEEIYDGKIARNEV